MESGAGRGRNKAGGLSKVTRLRVTDIDDSGSSVAEHERGEIDAPAPRIRGIERTRKGALGVGDRFLARIEERGQGQVAHPMKRLARGEATTLGVLHAEGERLWLRAIDKKERRELPISDAGDAQPGDLVLVEKAGSPPRITGRVVERLGDPFEPRSSPLVAIHQARKSIGCGTSVYDRLDP